MCRDCTADVREVLEEPGAPSDATAEGEGVTDSA